MPPDDKKSPDKPNANEDLPDDPRPSAATTAPDPADESSLSSNATASLTHTNLQCLEDAAVVAATPTQPLLSSGARGTPARAGTDCE